MVSRTASLLYYTHLALWVTVDLYLLGGLLWFLGYSLLGLAHLLARSDAALLLTLLWFGVLFLAGHRALGK